MKVTLLGCGTSSGVPRIGGDWGACDPADPRNRRSRASILIRTARMTILVDTGPDMREQLLAADVARLDAVIWTHDHADHCHGIDDLRQVYHARGDPVPGFASAATFAGLREKFAYVFEGRGGYPNSADATELGTDMMICDVRVRSVEQPHGRITSTGLRFDHGGGSIGYSTDFNIFTSDMKALFEGVDIWIVDALRYAPHPTHPHVPQVLGWIATLAPRLAVFTHMDQSLDYAALAAALPAGVIPGHDGLTLVAA